ncbi:MAG: EI24 domain-containing protein [Piscinibacter sp.]|uniref:EI24 domain-containing protein n=2 Tax=Piscinibacter sp. TaxID=1903157 RepID=UPI0035B10B3A
MKLMLDAFWRAAAYCLHPRVIALSVLPLVLMVVASLGLGYLFWDRAVDAVNATLQGWSLVTTFFTALERFGLGGLKSALAPLIIVFLATPVIVVVALLAVSVLMTPSMLHLVAQRRFPDLERRHGGSWWRGAFGSLLATLLALLAMLASIPLWLVPPLVLVLPPLIWGWLTYRVLSYDVLAEHASREERRELIRRHRMPLLAMGVLAGLLGAAPGLVWVSGGMFAALAPVLVPAAIWIYTLVFAFASLWFAHFALAALVALRLEREPPAPPPLEPPPFPPLDALPAP